jgi:hypothetical protein
MHRFDFCRVYQYLLFLMQMNLCSFVQALSSCLSTKHWLLAAVRVGDKPCMIEGVLLNTKKI